jgi:penicillin amidase
MRKYPYIVGRSTARPWLAHRFAAQLAGDSRIVEAVSRLQAWNFTTPTGVATGYDAADVDGEFSTPTPAEISHSIAATIYSVWRGQAIATASPDAGSV